MAITTITNAMVSVNAIQGTLIADNAITAVHIATNAVSGTLIADNAVTATHIAQNTITVTQLADDAVEADKIADGVITTNHLNKAMISSQTEVTAVAGDFLLIGDTSDSNNLKKIPISGITNLVSSNSISDADSDTKVQVEESSDEDKIRFDTGGTQRLLIDGNNLFLTGGTDARIQLNTGGSGTGTGNDTVHIRGDGDNMKLMTAADGHYIFENNGTERVRIDSSGNLQIVGGNQMTQGLFFYNGGSGHLLSGIRNKSNSSYNDSGGLEFLTSGTSNAAESVKMSIDTQGKVGIGTTGQDRDLVLVTEGTTNGFRINSNDEHLFFLGAGASSGGGVDDGYFGQYSGGTLKIQLQANGESYFNTANDIRFGHNGAYIATDECYTFYNGQRGRTVSIATAGNSSFYGIDMWNQVGGSCNQMLFRGGGSGATTGSITSTGDNATQYNTSSDYRLKENVDYTWDATTRLKQLKPVRFNWISDDTNTLEDGFLAHEVSSIVPNAVTGEKDAVYTEEEAAPEIHIDAGDIKRQQLDHSKLVPLMVKTIQELEARIKVLEG